MFQDHLAQQKTDSTSQNEVEFVELSSDELGSVCGGVIPVGGWGTTEISAIPVGGW